MYIHIYGFILTSIHILPMVVVKYEDSGVGALTVRGHWSNKIHCFTIGYFNMLQIFLQYTCSERWP